MVAEVKDGYPSEWAATTAVAAKLRSSSAETLRKWVHRVEVDVDHRPGVGTEQRAEINALKREVAERRRTNEILEAAHHDNLASRLNGGYMSVAF